ncbi:ABC transporter ATP-binding protein [Erysipelotrichaceae bacterium RD49]|nr:ABC transporter ATP-binding protein [Erysipelotrichaceae bacterium RD49]
MKLIFHYLKKHKLLFSLDLICAASFALTELGIPTLFGRMTNNYIDHGPQSFYYQCFGLILLAAVITTIGMSLLAYTSSKLSTMIVYEIRKDLFAHVMTFSIEEVDHFTVSSLITRTSSDSFQIMQFCHQIFRSALLAPIMLVVCSILVVTTSPRLSWFVLGTIPIILVGAAAFFKAAGPLSKRQQKSVDRINQILRENLNGIRVIRSFNRQKTEEARFEKENKEYQTVTSKLFKLMSMSEPLFFFLMNLSVMCIYYFAALLIQNNQIQLGELLMFVEYLFHCMMSVLVVCMICMMYPRAAVSAKRIEEVLETKPSIQSSGTHQLDHVDSLEFKNVSFAYPDSKSHSLSNISFQAKAGQKIALIGATGSGKSTVTKLISRFYDPNEGWIEINGQDIRTYTVESLRRQTALVSQKAHLFSGTIKDNITFGNRQASDDEILKAVKLAQAEAFVNERENGWNDLVSEEGTNLSGGQKQRLSIARAIVANTGLYILDDSFSALDLATDAKLRKALEPIQKKALFLIVAQRVSSILDCDQILVLDQGRLAACGTHQELYQSSELYRQIVLSQMSEEEAARYAK